MKKKKFKFSWIERLKFKAEAKRQVFGDEARYVIGSEKDADSYWRLTAHLPQLDDRQDTILSRFSKRLVKE